MNRPSYKELWSDEVKSNAEELKWVRDAVDGNAEVYTGEPYSEGEYLARKIMQMHARIAELEAELDRRIHMPKDLWFQVAELSTRVNELEAERRWIPVSERLPELDQDVFAVVDGELDRGHFYQQWDGEVFFSSDEKGAMMVATHWMPLPTQPEVQE